MLKVPASAVLQPMKRRDADLPAARGSKTSAPPPFPLLLAIAAPSFNFKAAQAFISTTLYMPSHYLQNAHSGHVLGAWGHLLCHDNRTIHAATLSLS